jgi:hypothetical protein
MSVALAVALLALLVALFAVVALVAVYARVRVLEAGRTAELSGYAALVGRSAPHPVRPRAGERGSVVAVIDADCALCHGVWDALVAAAGERPTTRHVALIDRPAEFRADPTGRAELLADADTRGDLFEGYSPTLLAVDATGTVVERRFVYADTDIHALLLELTQRQPTTGEVTRA